MVKKNLKVIEDLESIKNLDDKEEIKSRIGRVLGSLKEIEKYGYYGYPYGYPYQQRVKIGEIIQILLEALSKEDIGEIRAIIEDLVERLKESFGILYPTVKATELIDAFISVSEKLFKRDEQKEESLLEISEKELENLFSLRDAVKSLSVEIEKILSSIKIEEEKVKSREEEVKKEGEGEVKKVEDSEIKKVQEKIVEIEEKLNKMVKVLENLEGAIPLKKSLDEEEKKEEEFWKGVLPL